MKIKSLKSSVASMNLIVPIDGMITIDGNGIAEVSEQCAKTLVEMTNDWGYLDDTQIVPEETPETSENSADSNDETETEEEGISKQDLAKLSYKQLRETAVESGFPEGEWGKLKKDLLVEYLFKKMSE